MTAFSFVMMQFEVFEQWVSVAGRLSGFFNIRIHMHCLC